MHDINFVIVCMAASIINLWQIGVQTFTFLGYNFHKTQFQKVFRYCGIVSEAETERKYNHNKRNSFRCYSAACCTSCV